jgi:hypothetical protein
MKPQPTLVEIFKGVCEFCEKNSLEFPPTNGRPPILSFAQLLTLKISWELSRVKDFKTFYHGPMRKILEDFFPKEVLQKSLLGHFAPHEMRASRQCF